MFTSATSVQLDPFQDSVLSKTLTGDFPAKTKADSELAPAPPLSPRVVFKSVVSVHDVQFHSSTTPV